VAATKNVRHKTVWHELVGNYNFLACTLPASSSSKLMFESKLVAAAGALNPSSTSTWKSEKTQVKPITKTNQVYACMKTVCFCPTNSLT